jgi:hypothetical protein
MKGATKLLVDEELGEEKVEAPKPILTKGNKLVTTKQSANATRVLNDQPITSNRPTNIYKEWVVDPKNPDNTGWKLWWTTEQSDYEGFAQLVKFNPRTQEQLPVGKEWTIPFTVEKAKELIKESFGATTFYLKDGETTHVVKKFDLEELFLKDHKVGMTPPKSS